MSTQKPKNIVILGAGFGGVYAMRALHKKFHNNEQVRLILINKTNYFLFTPLLHEVATGNVEPAHIVEPLRKIVGCCLAQLHTANVESVSTKNQIVHTTDGDISYDYLVVALGARTNFFNTEGAEQHSFTLKSLNDAINLKNHFITTIEEASRLYHKKDLSEEEKHAQLSELLQFVVVGGGATGVELAAEMADFFFDTFSKYYKKEVMQHVRITILQKADELLPHFPKSLREKSRKALIKKGVDVRFGVSAQKVTNHSVELSDGAVLPTKTVIWTAGVSATPLSFDVPVGEERGRFFVEHDLSLKEHSNIFVVGDIAHLPDKKTGTPLPQLAQVATQQGGVVAKNIMNTMSGKKRKTFSYRHKGNLISLGEWMAAGEVGVVHVWGHIAWWLWRTIYLSKLISKQKRLRVTVDWTLNILQPRDVSQFYQCTEKGKEPS